MSESTKVMSFEEFRAAASAPFAEVARQQRAFFRSDAAAETILQAGGVPLQGWVEWPQSAALPGWPEWPNGNAVAPAKV